MSATPPTRQERSPRQPRDRERDRQRKPRAPLPPVETDDELVLAFAQLVAAWRLEDWPAVESCRRALNGRGVLLAFSRKFDPAISRGE